MTAYKGENVLIKKDGVVICAGINQKDISISAELIDDTANSNRGYSVSLPDSDTKSVTLGFGGIAKSRMLRKYRLEDDNLLTGITYEFANGDTITGNFIMSDYSESGSVGDAVKFNCSLKSTGWYSHVFSAGEGDSGGSVAVDPYFSSVSLLLHMDGANNSATFIDSSGNSFVSSVIGNAKISTDQSKFGGASGYFDGEGDYLSFSYSDKFVMSENFTIEFWIFSVAVTGNFSGVIYNSRIGGTVGGNFCLYSANAGLSVVGLDIFWGGTWRGISAPLSVGVWTHVAFVRAGDTLTLYKNGVSVNSINVSGVVFGAVGRGVFIGYNQIDNAYYNGYIDDLRITKGVARYAANFTPPIAQFPSV